MLDSRAISPEVKKLFADIAKQSEQYGAVFKRIDEVVSNFENTKSNMEGQLANVRNNIEKSILDLKDYARKTIHEFKDKTEKTHRLYLELDKIDKLKNDLFTIQDEIKTQSVDLSNSLVEFNAKADQRLESTINVIKQKIDYTIEEEVSKIETKVARRLVNFEGNQKVFEKKISAVDQNSKTAMNKLSGEVDYVYNSITEIKSDLNNYLESTAERIDYFEQAIPKILEMLEKVENIDMRPQAAPQPMSPIEQAMNGGRPVETPPPPLEAQEDFDDSLFDFDSTTFGDGMDDPNRRLTDRELMEKIKEEFDDFEARVNSQGSRQLIGLSLGGISFVGLIILVIIRMLPES